MMGPLFNGCWFYEKFLTLFALNLQVLIKHYYFGDIGLGFRWMSAAPRLHYDDQTSFPGCGALRKTEELCWNSSEQIRMAGEEYFKILQVW